MWETWEKEAEGQDKSKSEAKSEAAVPTAVRKARSRNSMWMKPR